MVTVCALQNCYYEDSALKNYLNKQQKNPQR